MQRHDHRKEFWRSLYGNGQMMMELCLSEPIDGERIHHSFTFKQGDKRVIPIRFWHWYTAYIPTLVLETQRGICREDDIERIS